MITNDVFQFVITGCNILCKDTNFGHKNDHELGGLITKHMAGLQYFAFVIHRHSDHAGWSNSLVPQH